MLLSVKVLKMRKELVESIGKAFVNGNKIIPTHYKNEKEKEQYDSILTLHSLSPMRDIMVMNIHYGSYNNITIDYDYQGNSYLESLGNLSVEQLLTIKAWLKTNGYLQL